MNIQELHDKVLRIKKNREEEVDPDIAELEALGGF